MRVLFSRFYDIVFFYVSSSLKDSEGVANLVVRDNAALKKFRMCTPVPPFLASALINEGGSSIPDLIVTAANKIRAFNKEHKDEK